MGVFTLSSEDSAIFINKMRIKFGICGKSQHDAVTLKHAPCWVDVGTGNTLMKTSPGTEIGRDEDLNH